MTERRVPDRHAAEMVGAGVGLMSVAGGANEYLKERHGVRRGGKIGLLRTVASGTAGKKDARYAAGWLATRGLGAAGLPLAVVGSNRIIRGEKADRRMSLRDDVARPYRDKTMRPVGLPGKPSRKTREQRREDALVVAGKLGAVGGSTMLGIAGGRRLAGMKAVHMGERVLASGVGGAAGATAGALAGAPVADRVIRRVTDERKGYDVERGVVMRKAASISELPKQEQRDLVHHKKQQQAIGLISGSMGVTALGMRTPQAFRLVTRRAPSPRMLAWQKRIAEPSEMLAYGAMGIGALGGFNAARINRAEAKADARVIASKSDGPEGLDRARAAAMKGSGAPKRVRRYGVEDRREALLAAREVDAFWARHGRRLEGEDHAAAFKRVNDAWDAKQKRVKGLDHPDAMTRVKADLAMRMANQKRNWEPRVSPADAVEVELSRERLVAKASAISKGLPSAVKAGGGGAVGAAMRSKNAAGRSASQQLSSISRRQREMDDLPSFLQDRSDLRRLDADKGKMMATALRGKGAKQKTMGLLDASAQARPKGSLAAIGAAPKPKPAPAPAPYSAPTDLPGAPPPRSRMQNTLTRMRTDWGDFKTDMKLGRWTTDPLTGDSVRKMPIHQKVKQHMPKMPKMPGLSGMRPSPKPVSPVADVADDAVKAPDAVKPPKEKKAPTPTSAPVDRRFPIGRALMLGGGLGGGGAFAAHEFEKMDSQRKDDVQAIAGGATVGALAMPVRGRLRQSADFKRVHGDLLRMAGDADGTTSVHKIPMRDSHHVLDRVGARAFNRTYTAGYAQAMRDGKVPKGQRHRPTHVLVYDDGVKQVDGAHGTWARTMLGDKNNTLKLTRVKGRKGADKTLASQIHREFISARHRARLKADYGIGNERIDARAGKVGRAWVSDVFNRRSGFFDHDRKPKIRPIRGDGDMLRLRGKQAAVVAGGMGTALAADRAVSRFRRNDEVEKGLRIRPPRFGGVRRGSFVRRGNSMAWRRGSLG